MKLNYVIVEPSKKETMKDFEVFYEEVLVPNFDVNQIETYEQFIENINEDDDGRCYYKILIVKNEEKEIAGGIIFDYYPSTNIGFIEYLATNSKLAQNGVGTFALMSAVNVFNELAKQHGYEKINYICCEVEKEVHGKKAKHYFWSKYGFKTLDFEYVQPPLDETKQAVTIMNFGIITNLPNLSYNQNGIKKEKLQTILYDYYFYDRDDAYFKNMMSKLNERKEDYIKFK